MAIKNKDSKIKQDNSAAQDEPLHVNFEPSPPLAPHAASIATRQYNQHDVSVPRVASAPIIQAKSFCATAITPYPPPTVRHPTVVVVSESNHDAKNVSLLAATARTNSGPPFCRPERADLLPKRHCCGLFSVPDRYIICKDEGSKSHWTDSKACSEVLTDLDWTDSEARYVATLLHRRSVACFWASACGLVLLFVIILILLGIQLDECKNCDGNVAILLLLGAPAGLICSLNLVTNARNLVIWEIDRTFREDGSRYQMPI